MPAPTVQAVALSLLRDKGIYSLAPSDAQPNTIRPADLDEVALFITSAFQEAAEASGLEQLRQPGYGFIHAPASVTMNVTQGSATIGGFAAFASWMPGCTVRFAGDPMDNEIISQTQLAHAYAGTTATATNATVYCDCFTLDETVEKLVGPIRLTDNRFCEEVTSLADFIRRSGYPVLPPNATGYDYPGYGYSPLWSMGPKASDQFPSAFYLDTYHDTSLDYIIRRVRLTPMPASPQTVVWESKLNPIRVTRDDITGDIQQLTIAGTPSDANIAQAYNFCGDWNGYHVFQGVTTPTYFVYFNLAQNGYIASAGMNPVNLPAEFWSAAMATTPLGSWNAGGTGSGALTATSTGTSPFADPGTKIRMPNGWVESILLPIARMLASSSPTFKNSDIRPEITRQYLAAKDRLKGAKISQKRTHGRYF